jgi:hypothetical protein
MHLAVNIMHLETTPYLLSLISFLSDTNITTSLILIFQNHGVQLVEGNVCRKITYTIIKLTSQSSDILKCDI